MGREVAEVRRLLRRLGQRIRVDRAIIFGSRVRGNHLRDSDLDLILVSKDFVRMPFTDRPKAVYPYWTSRLSLQVICLTPKEFEERSQRITIIREARKEGISLSGHSS